jgi:plasmid maintenance system antidote protein VapI
VAFAAGPLIHTEGNAPEFWLSLQASYDLKRTRRAIGDRLRQEITPRAA